MRLILIALSVLSITYLGLNQDSNCKHIGNITGWDATRCGCCQGWIIEFDGNTFLCDSVPNAKEIIGSNENTIFPIPVYFDFKRAKFCSDRRIIITCIKKR